MIKRHHLSFKNAFNGIKWALKTQPNYKVHISLSLLALLMSWFFNISEIEFLIILLLILIGFVIETINTSIEATTDAITKQTRDEIRIAKDVSAAAMLIYAFGAVLIAGYIFIPKIVSYILQVTRSTL